jgi:hypothetical protein
VPAAARIGGIPIAETSQSGKPRPAVAGAGWRKVGLDGDITPRSALSWTHVPVLGAEAIVIRTPIAPESAYVFGFRSLDPTGIPVEHDGVQARCGQPSGAGEISCVVHPPAVSADGATVRMTTIPSGIRCLTLQAT